MQVRCRWTSLAAAKDDGDLDKRIGETISIIGHF